MSEIISICVTNAKVLTSLAKVLYNKIDLEIVVWSIRFVNMGIFRW